MNSITSDKQTTNLASTAVSPFETFADNAIGIDAQIVKFTKGVWSIGQDAALVAATTRFVAVVTGARHGFVKWTDGKPVARHMLMIAENPVPPFRENLDDLDEDDWPIGKNGAPTDPWQFTYELPMVEEGEGARLYSTTSFGGRQAVGRLARTYAQHLRKHPGQLPIVVLKHKDYEHERYGTQRNPVLEIVDWITDPDWTEPARPARSPGSLASGLDDDIPFAPEWR